MLHDPTRHEPLQNIAWDETRVRDCIAQIVDDTEQRFTPEGYWPVHPLDSEDLQSLSTSLYYGACGVFWALRYLHDVGAAQLQRGDLLDTATLLARNHAWLGEQAETERASFLMGETPIRLLDYGLRPVEQTAARLASLIAGNEDHPSRELLWGSPGTMLAALFMHERTGQPRWAELFRRSAARLWSQLQWSPEHECEYWTQDLYGKQSSYLGAGHGFVGTVLPVVRGRHLLDAGLWPAWQACIANTVRRSATWAGDHVNWHPWLLVTPQQTRRWLMQWCHGAPGFVICLGDFPGAELDDVLLAAGRATWAAGPLNKGSNLCHGTGGNGYAFLKLYQRTGDALWLQRARAFAMHGIAQTEAHAAQYGQLRYSLWTGDPGFAIYLWDCLQARASFPTLDVFFGGPVSPR